VVQGEAFSGDVLKAKRPKEWLFVQEKHFAFERRMMVIPPQAAELTKGSGGVDAFRYTF